MEQCYEVVIRRLLCAECGKTFGLIPEFIDKYCRYAKGVIQFAVRMLARHTYEEIAEWFSASCIEIMTLHRWRRRTAT